MFSTYVIEVGEEQVGIVVLERAGFRFFAALMEVRALEGEVYRTVAAATEAATRLLTYRDFPSGFRARGRSRRPSEAGEDRPFLEGWRLGEREPRSHPGEAPASHRALPSGRFA